MGLFDEGLGVFGEMLKAGVVPDEVVMASVVKGVAGLGALDVGIWVHGYIVKTEEEDFGGCEAWDGAC